MVQEPASPLPLTEVRRSRRHGHGLHATQPIPAGALIGIAEGTTTQRNGAHVLWLQEGASQTRGLRVRNALRFVNHSASPNACFFGAELWSLQPIGAGIEITHDYAAE